MNEDEIREFSGGHGLLIWLSSAGISPYAAYSFMKERFGPPQRKAKTLKEYDKVQWTFYIKSNNSMLRVYDWKLFEWSIGVATRMLRPGVSHEDTISAEEESKAMADAKLLLTDQEIC